MKIIKTVSLPKYDDEKRYTRVQGDIFQDATGGVGAKLGVSCTPVFCVTLHCEMEIGEDSQYPVEDILDQYLVNCTDMLEEKIIDGKHIYIFEVKGDSLQNINKVAGLIGKRVFNYEEEGRMKLGIE